MIVYVVQNIGGDDNSTDYINVMVNHHCHGDNRIITH